MAAVFATLMGVLAMMSWNLLEAREENRAAHAVALNYAVYRQAANRYALSGNATVGDIPMGQLALPPAWRSLKEWKTRIEGGHCYVYGPSSHEEGALIRDLFRGSYAIGRKDGGIMIPTVNGTRLDLPGWIADGSVVSVINID
ncbi:type IV pilus biogenesis protein PilM [Nitratidesulfovibrio vulgaris]|uniref:type IV pilus biogenesis protein PilM n=1 Tax=Nitratidesulfovibrio vulgaris TaxID=881 RepID=UPI002FDEB6EC